jgi:hypothetical protein
MDRTDRNKEGWERRRAAVLAGLSHRDLLALTLYFSSGGSPWSLANTIDRGTWHDLRLIAAEALYPARVSIQPIPEDDPAGPALF